VRRSTRVDWRFLLGIGPESVVVADHVDETGGPFVPALAPWVASVLVPGPAARDADWVFVGAAHGVAVDEARLRAALDMTRSGGRVVLTVENRYGLHWLADWRPLRDGTAARASLHSGYTRAKALLWRAGAVDVRAYALLPHHEAPRAIIPVEPPCPPTAQRLALEQVWQRATPLGAVARALLGLGVATGLMLRMYPHYLLVGRKP
jgi:hypothetical protein